MNKEEVLKIKVDNHTYTIECFSDKLFTKCYRIICTYPSPYGKWDNYSVIETGCTKINAVKKLIKHLRDKEKDYLSRAKKYANGIIKLENKLAKDKGI